MKFKEIRSYLLSPALPAVGLLFGMVFCLAFARFAGLRWQPSATITLYSTLLVWVALLAWRHRKLRGGFGVGDALFGAFILLVLASLAIQGVPTTGGWKYGQYLPFLAIVPYVCGRLMRAGDIRLLSGIFASAGLVMLVLLVIDYWQNLVTIQIYSRWPFFGYGYTPLLVGIFLAGSLATRSFFFQTGADDTSQLLSLRKVGGLLALGLVAGGLVGTAARGAILAGVFSTFCLILLVRHWSLLRKFALLLYLVISMVLAHSLLPKPQVQSYANLETLSVESIFGEGLFWRGTKSTSSVSEPSWVSKLTRWNWEPTVLVWRPILGEESCSPLYKGVDSFAIRGLLYREAVAIFMDWPWWGVGASGFGWNSCSGEMGFPHSTVLHVLAELGIAGGLLFVGLMAGACMCFVQKAVEATATAGTQAAQLALALFLIYLVTDQIYGNYFMATGSYLLTGVAAGMRSNSCWSDGIRENDVE